MRGQPSLRWWLHRTGAKLRERHAEQVAGAPDVGDDKVLVTPDSLLLGFSAVGSAGG